jgi:hypothetical protein
VALVLVAVPEAALAQEVVALDLALVVDRAVALVQAVLVLVDQVAEVQALVGLVAEVQVLDQAAQVLVAVLVALVVNICPCEGLHGRELMLPHV